MTDRDMTLDAYLAAGGVLTSPANVPPRYRAELLKLMATFVDSELAGAAGFADIINAAPGLRERIAAASIVLEKTSHAQMVLEVMAGFGVDTARYATHHPWTERLARDADIGARRGQHDMRLAVFNYPLSGWSDAVMMNLLMGMAVGIQLQDYVRVSYQPLAEAFRQIAPVEDRHTDLARAGARNLCDTTGVSDLQHAADYWWPHVRVSFGATTSPRFEALSKMGLRHTSNAAMIAEWEQAARDALGDLGITPPG